MNTCNGQLEGLNIHTDKVLESVGTSTERRKYRKVVYGSHAIFEITKYNLEAPHDNENIETANPRAIIKNKYMKQI